MTKRLLAAVMFIVILSYSCVKETYDMDRLSGQAEVNPAVAVPVFTGKIILGDAVKESDTVVYDNDNFVRLVYRKDSVINIQLKDYLNLDNLVTFSDSYTIGEISIAAFQGTMAFTLDEISTGFATPLRNQFLALDDGLPHPFPPFPAITLGNKTFTAFPNFQNAVFSSGSLDISVTNNFGAKLSGLQVTLSNSMGVLGVVDLPEVNPNTTVTSSIGLAGKTLTNTITASVTLAGSPGNLTPVIIDLDNNNISLTARGRDLKVTSGRIIVPSQLISSAENSDTVTVSPGNGIELDQLRINSGNLKWQTSFNSSLNASMTITMPSIIRNGSPFVQPIIINQPQSQGSISLQNTSVGFSSDPASPYNRLPVVYNVSVNSNNILIDFHSTDQIQLSLNLTGADFDYIKGYFGQQNESVAPDTLDFGIEEYMKNVSGDFFLADPSARIIYSNSFGVPIEVAFNGLARKGAESVNLGLSPFVIAYPNAPANKQVTASFTVNKSNSRLPDLISLPPESVIFSGSAKMNPAGDPQHLRNNYVYGNSSFTGAIEMELPLELSLNNLQLTDTTDNFLSGNDEDSEFNSGDIELGKIMLNLKNGFPFDISVKLSLYDSMAKKVKSTIDIPELLKAAPIDGGGRVNGVSESTSTIEVTDDFFDNINSSDKIIISFRISTTDAPKNVRIYSDYGIDFGVSVFVKAKVKFDL